MIPTEKMASVPLEFLGLKAFTWLCTLNTWAILLPSQFCRAGFENIPVVSQITGVPFQVCQKSHRLSFIVSFVSTPPIINMMNRHTRNRTLLHRTFEDRATSHPEILHGKVHWACFRRDAEENDKDCLKQLLSKPCTSYIKQKYFIVRDMHPQFKVWEFRMSGNLSLAAWVVRRRAEQLGQLQGVEPKGPHFILLYDTRTARVCYQVKSNFPSATSLPVEMAASVLTTNNRTSLCGKISMKSPWEL